MWGFDIGFVVCGPNEALVISGIGHGNSPSFVIGGSVFVVPFIQKIQRIPLNIMTLEVKTPRVHTANAIPVSVVGTAQVKINGLSREMLTMAAEIFGEKDESEILQVCLSTMEGHQRAITGNMTAEEIYRDRETF
eukprot:TRINITY_DN4254_c0_g1_i1.p1 TRINITY_DN4254_c0_g1~~TRINITY_DN4254_c0_g1_i1.p1  ORF type:complete len:135 (+),score=34.32 TRINITY_DN4254_c0_g1_i1:119-523(+)